MTWLLTWRNLSTAVLNATLQLLVLYRYEVLFAVMQAIANEIDGFFLSTAMVELGRLDLYKAILAAVRSQEKIALAIATSGIAALLLPRGRTAHSRFYIPINIFDESTCEIKQGMQVTELLLKTSVILWDEAPMAHRNFLEALDRSLRDILRFQNPDCANKPFGGKVVVLGGDFQQILQVVKKGRREDIVHFAINKSYLWKECQVFKLHTNMRLLQNRLSNSEYATMMNFSKWILKIGNDIVRSTYPDLQMKVTDHSYLQDRAILAPTNEVVEELNDYVVSCLQGEDQTHLSSDSICKASSNIANQDITILPNHKLKLKIGLPIMLLRNLNQNAGLCNETRLVITKLGTWVIEAKIITGINIGAHVFIPRITMSPICFAMIINQSQGQSLKHVGVYPPNLVFSHG
ncbi:hypothetical protein ACB092_05G109200 [Castanea dentata]